MTHLVSFLPWSNLILFFEKGLIFQRIRVDRLQVSHEALTAASNSSVNWRINRKTKALFRLLVTPGPGLSCHAIGLLPSFYSSVGTLGSHIITTSSFIHSYIGSDFQLFRICNVTRLSFYHLFHISIMTDCNICNRDTGIPCVVAGMTVNGSSHIFCLTVHWSFLFFLRVECSCCRGWDIHHPSTWCVLSDTFS